MSKDMNLQSLFCGILFCISITALIIACLAYTNKNQRGEYYQDTKPLRGLPSPKSYNPCADNGDMCHGDCKPPHCCCADSDNIPGFNPHKDCSCCKSCETGGGGDCSSCYPRS